MTMNYCGRCGSANGTAARFCRQCGAELGSQAAISSSSTPHNVEFSSKSVMKNPVRETEPTPPDSNLDAGPKPPMEMQVERSKQASEAPGGESSRLSSSDAAK